jgi:hypothetical protein
MSVETVLVLSSMLTAWAAGPTAVAAPHRVFGQDVRAVPDLTPNEVLERRAAFEAMLEERGWVQHDDQILPADRSGGFEQPDQPVEQWSFPPHRATIYLNFFGAELSPGTNADLDESPCVNQAMEWPGFAGTDQQARALIEVFERQMEPYGVEIAYEQRPPGHLPYAMVMMGGTPQMLGLGSGVLGVSCSSDCGDRWWRDTTFAFTGAINLNNAAVLGTTALHEAAHAFGLAHIGDSTRIMNPFVGSANVTWADTCTPYDAATGGINCMPVHDEFCDGGAQNTHAELMAYFGPRTPDIEPPVVQILSPEDGLELDVGASVTIDAEISDDHDGVGWKLIIPEVEQEQIAYTFQKQWFLQNLPAGVYTLRIEAIDHARNEGADEVTIYVGMDAPETTGTTGDGDTDETGDGETDDGDDGDTEPDPAGGATDPGGCGCVTSPRSGAGALAVWFLLLPALRRRRIQDHHAPEARARSRSTMT